jgi:hypothetical protein
MLPVLAILTSPAAKYALGAAALAASLYAGYSFIYNKGYEAARTEALAASSRAQTQADLLVSAARKQGDKLAASLASTQRKLNETQTEYLAYANGISGNCPASLGVLIAAASSSSGNLPNPASNATNSPATLEAALIAANVATNYSRHAECIAGFNALIDWHEQAALSSSSSNSSQRKILTNGIP